MKKLFKMLSVVLLVVILTGCVKQTVHMNITEEEVTIEVTNAMDSSLMDDESLASMLEEYESLGFDVKEYKAEEDENLVGVVYSKTYKLDDVSSTEDVEFHLENIAEELKETPKIFKKDGSVYKAKMIFNTTESDTGDYSAEELESYASSFEISYSVTLPSKAKSHNADKVDGNTYTWNIEYGENAEINYEFDVKGSSSSMVLYIIIGAVVIVVIVVIFLVLKNKKGNNVPPTTTNGATNPSSQMPTEPGVYMNNGTQVVVPPTQEQPTDPNQNVQ